MVTRPVIASSAQVILLNWRSVVAAKNDWKHCKSATIMAASTPFRKGKQPMIYLSVRHTVADYAKWRPYFDADESKRRASGSTGVQYVYRDLANPNDITVVLEWDNPENVQKFVHDPALAETMKTAGVMGAPEARFLTHA
jgi:hypothetical protein